MTTIIVRRGERAGTTAELVAANEILLADEICIEHNVAGKRLMKVGDGVTHWVDLPYITADLTSPAHAVDVTFTPAGSIGSTNVQAALAEVDGDVTGLAGSKVDKATLDAQSVLGAVVDNTPVAIVLGASQLLGRKATGNVGPITVSEALALLAVYSSTQTDTAISTQINALVGGAPGLLDTLKELADALGDDPNFAATITAALATKAADNAVVKLTGDQTVDGIKKMLKRPLTSEFAGWSGIPVNGTAASAAITALEAAPGDLKALVVRPGETILIDTTIAPATIDWEVKRGGMIVVAAGQTFTPRSIKAGAYRIFDLSAGGSHVVFGGWQIAPYAEWFGATPDGVVGISGRAFNDGSYAIAAGSIGSGTLFSTPGVFAVEETISRRTGVNLPGHGPGRSTLKMAPGTNLRAVVETLNFDSLTTANPWSDGTSRSSFDGWTVDGNKANQTAVPTVTSAPFNLPFGGGTTTIDVSDATLLPASGIASINTLSGNASFAYTGKAGNTLTGCSGGVGRTITGATVHTHGWGLRTWGWDEQTERVNFVNCAADGWVTAGSNAGNLGDPSPEVFGFYRAIKSFSNGRWGIDWAGPSDSEINGAQCFRNGLGGFINGGHGTVKLVGVHCWGVPQRLSFEFHSTVDCVDCIAEVPAVANARGIHLLSPMSWHGGEIFVSSPGLGGMIGIEVDHITAATGITFDGMISGCVNGSIKFTNDAGGNHFRADVDQATGTVIVGTPAATTIFEITPIRSSTFKPFSNKPGNWVSKAANYTLLVGEDGVLGTGGAGGITITGPVVPAIGRPYAVKKVDAAAGAVTFTPTSGTVDGAANFPLVVQYQSATFVFDGTNWSVV